MNEIKEVMLKIVGGNTEVSSKLYKLTKDSAEKELKAIKTIFEKEVESEEDLEKLMEVFANAVATQITIALKWLLVEFGHYPCARLLRDVLGIVWGGGED